MGIDFEIRNEESKLFREWIILDDPRMPLGFDVEQTQGLNTGRYFNGHSHDILFRNRTYLVVRTEAICAFEVRHLTFDVWGNHFRTLTATEIADHAVASTIQLDHKWNLYSENEAWEFYASITYIARVRTAAGKVIEAETDAVLREARRFSEKFTIEQLEPSAKKP